MLMLMLFVSWISFYNTMNADFSPDPRYYVYDSTEADANYLKLNLTEGSNEPDELKRMLIMFDGVAAIAGFYTQYAATSTLSLMIMTLRLIKMLDFQPRMDLVTRTMAAAANDLGHFFGLFALVFLGFSTIAYMNFGRSIESFSSIGWSSDTCFRLMLGDTGPYDSLLTTSNAMSAVIFYYIFMGVVFFILLNILLAILVDAYVAVKSATEEEASQTMPQEILDIIEDCLKHPNRKRMGQPGDENILQVSFFAYTPLPTPSLLGERLDSANPTPPLAVQVLSRISNDFAMANTEDRAANRRVLRWKKDVIGYPTLVSTLVQECGLTNEQAVTFGQVLLERFGEDQEVLIPGRDNDVQKEEEHFCRSLSLHSRTESNSMAQTAAQAETRAFKDEANTPQLSTPPHLTPP
jgi:hypothetical protein